MANSPKAGCLQEASRELRSCNSVEGTLAPQAPFASTSGTGQVNTPLSTTTETKILADHSNIYQNCTVNHNYGPKDTENSGQQVQQPAVDETKLAFIMENCVGKTVDVRVKIYKITEPAGLKQRKKAQFRGSFIVADETAFTNLKIFGPHGNDTMALFRPNQCLYLKKVIVNPENLSFNSVSSAVKSATSIKISESKVDEDENMSLEQISMFGGIASTKVFVEKVGEVLERGHVPKSRKKAWVKRELIVKERVDMQPFTLVLWGDLARKDYEEGKFYIFTKVRFNREYQNLGTVENCRAIRCPDA